MHKRNDSIILGQQVDMNKAADLLKMFQEAGKEKIDVWTILDESAPKIKSFATLEAKLEQLAGSHETCKVSVFSNWMKVSRSTVYTWRGNNYLIYSGNKVNLPETLHLPFGGAGFFVFIRTYGVEMSREVPGSTRPPTPDCGVYSIG